MPAEVPTAEEFANHQRDLDALWQQVAQTVRHVRTSAELVGALNECRDRDGGVIHLAAGIYTLTSTVSIPSSVRLVGAGPGVTSIRANVEMPALLTTDPYASAVGLAHLRLDCAGNAEIGLDVRPGKRVEGDGAKDFGVTAPDPRFRAVDVHVYDAASVGVYMGGEARGSKLRDVVVRRAGYWGFWLRNPDSEFIGCEATTSKPVTAATAAVDELAKPSQGAGFYVGAVNSVFVGCKAWYCRGYGWHVKGTRNRFVADESQDTLSHGWRIEYGRNTYGQCIADNASFPGVGATPGTADGFYIDGVADQAFVGCLAFSRSASQKCTRNGFNVDDQLLANIDGNVLLGTRFVANEAWDCTGTAVWVR